MATFEGVGRDGLPRPGGRGNERRAKYEPRRDARQAVVPTEAPGLPAAEIKERLLPLLPDALFPGGAKAGWWQKGVQLDLEARGQMARADTKPLRFYRP